MSSENESVTGPGAPGATQTVHPSRVSGTVTVPSSKSHTIRALLIAGCAAGTSRIENALDSADARSCITALEALGVTVTTTGRTATGLSLTVKPPPGGMLAGFADDAPGSATEANRTARIDVGNSGTTLYLMTALAALRPGGICFDGDASIRRRSAAQLLDALRALGATVAEGEVAGDALEESARDISAGVPPTASGSDDTADTPPPGCAPYCVSGPWMVGRTVAVESPTSQYLSALLLAAPLAPLSSAPPGPTTVAGAEQHGTDSLDGAGDPGATRLDIRLLNERPYVDMTCWWLDAQGISYEREGYDRFSVPAGQHYRPFEMALPGDYSSATFWFCAAAVTGGSVTVRGLARDDVQGDREVLEILGALGCEVTWNAGGAPAGVDGPGAATGAADGAVDGTDAVTVSGAPTRGGSFDLNAMPDALPALAVAACFAPERVELRNVPQARQKETDRIAVMAAELGRLGARIEERDDGLVIHPAALSGGSVSSHGDHRVAMAMAVAALGAAGPVTITDAEAAAVTYPAFFAELPRIAEGSLSATDGSRGGVS
jgi:3-phosphoshikimate 1-carboxyvinyltransferase